MWLSPQRAYLGFVSQPPCHIIPVLGEVCWHVFTGEPGQHLGPVLNWELVQGGRPDELAEGTDVSLPTQQRDDRPGDGRHGCPAHDGAKEEESGGSREVLGAALVALSHHVPGVIVPDDTDEEEGQSWDADGSQPIDVVAGRGAGAVEGEDREELLAAHRAQGHQAVEDHHIFALEEQGEEAEVLSDEGGHLVLGMRGGVSCSRGLCWPTFQHQGTQRWQVKWPWAS